MRAARLIPRRRFSGLDARALRRAGAISRVGYLHGFGVLGNAAAPMRAAQPAAWQTDPAALLALAKATSGGKQPLGRLGTLAYFRGFGLSPTADTVVSAVGSKAAAAGASAAATALGAGAAAGPIGLAAGAVIAIALTLFQKQYFNVADANAACASQEQAWQKYLSIQGHVAGRALGWPTMMILWHGAVGAGLFPLNSQHLTFHEGTLNCAGTGAWSDSFLGETLQGTSAGCSQDNCMPSALEKFRSATVPSGTPDAVYFVDSILLPLNKSDAIPWITNAASNPTVHQLLYDVADAFLAENNVASTAYVKYPAAGTTASAASTSTSVPPTAPAVPKTILTVDGSRVTDQSAALQNSVGTLFYFGPIVDSAGNRSIWRYPSGGSPAQESTGVVLQLDNGGNFYSEGAGGHWYEWSGSAWTQISAAPVTPVGAAAPAPSSAAAPKFPGFDTSLVASDPRLTEAWSVSESTGSALWTPTGNGFYSAAYSGVTSQIQIAVNGTALVALRQDSNGNWATYTGTFDASGLSPSGQKLSYSSVSPNGAPSNWSAAISSPQTTAAATAPSASLTTPMMTEGSTGASPQVNVTVSSPTSTPLAAAAPAALSNTLLWVALAGVGALGLILLMSHDKR